MSCSCSMLCVSFGCSCMLQACRCGLMAVLLHGVGTCQGARLWQLPISGYRWSTTQYPWNILGLPVKLQQATADAGLKHCCSLCKQGQGMWSKLTMGCNWLLLQWPSSFRQRGFNIYYCSILNLCRADFEDSSGTLHVLAANLSMCMPTCLLLS
jgi:hypothetical protein